MDEKLVEQYRKNLEEKSTEELLKVWEENNRVEWLDEAFEAIRKILIGRGEILPAQKIDEEQPEAIKKCPNCGLENLESALWCRCRHDFRIGGVIAKYEDERRKGVFRRWASSLSLTEKRFIDKEGFIRKHRGYWVLYPMIPVASIWIGFVFGILYGAISYLLYAVSILDQLPKDADVFLLAGAFLYLVPTFVLFQQFKTFITYDIHTWKHAKHIVHHLRIIFLVFGLFGMIIYYRMKEKERAFLKVKKGIE